MKKHLALILVLLPVLFLFIACEQQPVVNYNLNVQVDGQGVVYPSSGSFPSGHLIAFNLEPKAGWSFSHWSGRDSQQVVNNGNRYEILMDRDMFLTAVFTGSSTEGDHELNVRVEGRGSVSPNSGKFKNNQEITFDIRPETGWVFSRWEGTNKWDVVRSGDKWTLRMDGKKDLIAVFEQSQAGQYNLDIIIEGRGRVDQKLVSDAETEASYPSNSTILLTAIAENGWSFKEWLGDVRGSTPFATIKMDSNKRVTAIFIQEERTLTINVVGKGDVEERLVNDIEATGKYPNGSEVRLFAKPADGWAFKEWRDDARGYDPVVRVLMDGDKKVTAVFEQHNNTLDIKIQGKGRVEKRLTTDSEEYPADSVVRLWAKPDDGWAFARWTGDATGRDPIVHIEMDTDKSVTAIFERATFNLDITIVGKGKVEERLISDEYDEGSVVRLTAKPNSGWEFIEWRGDARGSRESIDVEMDYDKEITAVFEELKGYKLTVNITGKGRVNVSPDKKEYDEGEKVSLSAVADSGNRFKEWRGDASGSNAQIQITMNRNMTVEAVFETGPATGTGEVSGSIKLTHTWPHPYTGNNSAPKSENVGKIPVLHTLGAQPVVRQEYVEDELFVGFRNNDNRISILSFEDQVGILEASGLNVARSIPELDVHIVKTNQEVIKYYANSNNKMEDGPFGYICGVEYIEPIYMAYTLSSTQSTKVPNDPMYKQQWHYNQIRLPHAWAVTTGSSSVRVAVLDTGVNSNHVDLQGRVDTASGWNFTSNNSNTNDGNGHGTHCAGTIGATTNNGVGVAGVMWQGQIIPVKVLSDSGSGSWEGIINGMLYSAGLLSSKPISQKAHVLSMSLGGGGANTTMQNACRSVVNAGCLLVVAAGNSNGPVEYPGKYAECITIGSTGYNYPGVPKRAPYSSYGAELDVMAPGGDTKVDTDRDGNVDGVLSTTGSGYQYFQGTSMATPHVAGIVGLMLSNGVPASEVRSVLRRTAMDLGGGDFNNQFGYGLVNVYWAVCNVKEIKIVVGNKNGNKIDAVAEGKVDLRAKTYTLSKIPAGEYQVFGWIDVRNTGTVDSGDYLFESNKMTFSDGQKLTANMELKEVK